MGGVLTEKDYRLLIRWQSAELQLEEEMKRLRGEKGYLSMDDRAALGQQRNKLLREIEEEALIDE